MDYYKTFLLPVLDYTSNVYGSTQKQALEKLQHSSLRIIFGYGCNIPSKMDEYDLMHLEARRETLQDQFIMKALQNEHFSNKWFPNKEQPAFTSYKKTENKLTAKTDQKQNE